VEGQQRECWTGTEPIDALAALGIHWQLEGDEGGFDVGEPLEAVVALLQPLEVATTVHGDLHAGNVLLPDDRVPRLIDFARAGAGHPAFDFVRLSSAIAYASLRCLVPEARMRAYFFALHSSTRTAGEIAADFPDMIAGALAEIANTALVLGRDAATAALPADENGRAEYAAMVYLVAAQSLTRPEFQSGIVRAALGGVRPLVRDPTRE
jgi:Ser/Thr protein kinase RdoA (MazF antagonist)